MLNELELHELNLTEREKNRLRQLGFDDDQQNDPTQVAVALKMQMKELSSLESKFRQTRRHKRKKGVHNTLLLIVIASLSFIIFLAIIYFVQHHRLHHS